MMARTYRDFRNDLPQAANLTSAFSLTQDALAELFITRHKVYGPENIRLPGMAGIAVHLLDKWARVKGIVLDGHADEGETLEDSLADIAVYAIIGLMLKSGEWDLPCVERGDELKATILDEVSTRTVPLRGQTFMETHKELKRAGINLSNGDTLSWTITVSKPQEKPKEPDAVFPDKYVPVAGSWRLACLTCGRAFYSNDGPFCSPTCMKTHTELKRATISIAHDCDLESDACDCLDRDDNSTVTGTDRGYHAFSDGVRDNLPRMAKGQQKPKVIGK